MSLSPADRELLREFWREVRADPAKLGRLIFLAGVLLLAVAAVLTGVVVLLLRV